MPNKYNLNHILFIMHSVKKVLLNQMDDFFFTLYE